MRKLFALLLVLCLIPAVALAQTADPEGAAESEIITYDFGGFTMDIPADIQGQILEPVSGQILFQFYPDYDATAPFQKSFNCVWVDGYDDLTQLDPVSYAQLGATSFVTALRLQGIVIENEQILNAVLDEHEGKPAMSYVISMDADYAALGLDLKTTLYMAGFAVSDETLGTYAFTISVTNPEDIDPILEMMNTIKWAA